MKFSSLAFAAGLAVASSFDAAGAAEITGAGATFPFPVYAKWAEAYKKDTNISLNYQSIGSSGGIRQIRAKTVDFGATDAPLKGEELEKDGFVQFPMVMGGVVAVVNIPGIETGKLKLSGDALADIFNGKITKWNDPKIAADQRGRDSSCRHHHPGLSLGRIGHDQRFHRPICRRSPKAGRAAPAPARRCNGRSARAARATRASPHSSSRCRTPSAMSNMPTPSRTASRSHSCGTRTASSSRRMPRPSRPQPPVRIGTRLPATGSRSTDQPGDEAWPITAPTFILVPKAPEKPEQVAEVLKFFDWAFKSGDQMASELDYVPLPAQVKDAVRATWASDIKDKSGQAVFKK